MKKAPCTIGIIILLFSSLHAQTSIDLSKNPTKLNYIISGHTIITNDSLNDGNGAIITFEIEPENTDTVTFEGLKLQNYNIVVFYLRKACKFYLKNSSFKHVNQILFEYEKKSVLYPGDSTEIHITSNNFDNSDDFRLMNKWFIYFKGVADESEIQWIKNVWITDNKILIGNNRSEYPQDGLRSAISFVKDNDNQYFGNIYIYRNDIYMNGQRVLGIMFSHDFSENEMYGTKSGDYRPYPYHNLTQNSLYVDNSNIEIKSNRIIAHSSYPHFGIFVQGPYSNVTISNNIVDGFGLTAKGPKGYIKPQGAIDLYGSRIYDKSGKSAYYSNNIRNARVEFNSIQTYANGIRVTGGDSIRIYKNDIKYLGRPAKFANADSSHGEAGIRVQGGNVFYPGNETGTQDIDVSDNYIDMNNKKGKVGIFIQHAKNFQVIGNKIDSLNGVGIYFYANTHFNQGNGKIAMGIGKSKIEGNIMDYGSNPWNPYSGIGHYSISPIYTIRNAAIVLQRAGLKYPAGELLSIADNKVKTNLKASYVDHGYNRVKLNNDTAWSNVNFPRGKSVKIETKPKNNSGVN